MSTFVPVAPHDEAAWEVGADDVCICVYSYLLGQSRLQIHVKYPLGCDILGPQL